jgi:hypothetical protein
VDVRVHASVRAEVSALVELPAIAAAPAAPPTTTTATTAAVAVVAAAATAAVATATTAVVTAAATTAATTAAIATAATTAAVATTTAATATALLARLGLVHAQRPTVERTAIHTLDGLRGLLGGPHRDEGEATRPAGLAVCHEVDVADGSELLERSADAISIGVEREIPNIQTSVHRVLVTGPSVI